jgi:hypothetical protein
MTNHKAFRKDEEYECGALTMRIAEHTGTRWTITAHPNSISEFRCWYIGNGHTRTCWLSKDEVIPMLRFMDDITRKAFKKGRAG